MNSEPRYELLQCPSYVAHPQSVWFETHWRPAFEAMRDLKDKAAEIAIAIGFEHNKMVKDRDRLAAEVEELMKVDYWQDRYKIVVKERDEWEYKYHKLAIVAHQEGVNIQLLKERDAAIAERDEYRDNLCAQTEQTRDVEDKYNELCGERNAIRARAEAAEANLNKADCYKIEAFRSKLALDAEREKSAGLLLQAEEFEAEADSLEAKLRLAVVDLEIIASNGASRGMGWTPAQQARDTLGKLK